MERLANTYSTAWLKEADPSLAKATAIPSWLKERRKELYEQIVRQGLPSLKDESYRRTPLLSRLGKLDAATQEIPAQPAVKQLSSRFSMPESLKKADAIRVCLDGTHNGSSLNGDLSTQDLPQGLEVRAIVDPTHTPYQKELVEKHLATSPLQKEDNFVAANTLCFQNGVFVHVAKGTHCTRPLVLETHAGGDTCPYPRAFIYLEEGATLSVVELQSSGLGNGLGSGLGSGLGGMVHQNSVVEVFCGKGASLSYVKVQDGTEQCLRVDHTYISLQKDAKLKSFVFTAGGNLTRNNLYVRLEEKDAEASLQGLYLCGEKTHIDNHSSIDHQHAETYSQQTYKGILGGKGCGVFNGRIFMRHGASGCTAYQTNKNLLVSSGARVHAKPQLEIWVDDVKCSHGCTMGQLSEEQRFYLRSRGIPPKIADELLLRAFAEEVFTHCPMPFLVKPLSELLDTHFQSL